MAFALIFVGIIMAVSAVRGTYNDLFALVKDDFTGPNNFLFWAVIVLIIGSIGYIRPLRPLSQAFLVVIVLVLVLTRGNPSGVGGGLFQQLYSEFVSGTNPPAN